MSDRTIPPVWGLSSTENVAMEGGMHAGLAQQERSRTELRLYIAATPSTEPLQTLYQAYIPNNSLPQT